MRMRHAILLGITGFAVTAGPAYAADDTPGFNELDRDGDGALSRTEAAGNPALAARFNEVDDDGDGEVSRYEYVKRAAAEDLRNLRERAAEFLEPDREKRDAATGATQGKER